MSQEDGSLRPSEVDRLQIPLAIIILAVFLMVGFQTVQLVRDRSQLLELEIGQEAAVQEGVKLRQNFETLVNRTGQLAEAGNPHAKAIVDDLRRQGIMPGGAQK
jgi:signal transduction histidine kinase